MSRAGSGQVRGAGEGTIHRRPGGARRDDRRRENDQHDERREPEPGEGRERLAHTGHRRPTERGHNAITGQDDPSRGHRPDDLADEPGDEDRGDHLGRAAQDPQHDRRRDVERAGQFAIRDEHHPHRSEGEDDRQRDERRQPGGEDPAGDPALDDRASSRWCVPRGRPAKPPNVRIDRDHPDALRLERRRQPAGAHEPGDEPAAGDGTQDERPSDVEGKTVTSRERKRQQNPTPLLTSMGSTTIHDPAAQEERRRGQRPGGRGRQRGTQRSEQRRAPVHGAGLVDAPGLGAAKPGARTLSRWIASPTSPISLP